jgi:poly(3-hydroxybutyrate) depolymerase
LAKNPNIDTNRVFLSGSSAETPYLNQLVAEKPDLWKGVILLSPSELPDLSMSNMHLSSMFIVAGANDGNSLEWLTKYQDQAAAAGISVKLLFLGDAQHITRSIASERNQLQQCAEYLSGN